MRFAGDDCAGCAQPLYEPGILRSFAVQIAIEMHAATGGRLAQVKAILYRNGQSPKRTTTVAEGPVHTAGHGLGAHRFSLCPCAVLPEISIVSGILAGARESLCRKSRGPRRSICQSAAQSADCPTG